VGREAETETIDIHAKGRKKEGKRTGGTVSLLRSMSIIPFAFQWGVVDWLVYKENM
jgi:hypothetical protein